MLGSVLGTVGGTALNLGANMIMQKDAQSFQKHSAKQQYQWAVKDMRQAGLNPILAATGGFGGAKVGSGSGSSVGSQDIMGGAQKSSSAALNKQLLDQSAATTAKEAASAAHLASMKAGQDIANSAAAYRLQQEKLKGGLYKSMNETGIPKLNQWFSNSARDVKNRLGYIYQDLMEQGRELGEKANKVILDIHPRK